MFMEAEEFSMSFGKSSSAGTFIKIWFEWASASIHTLSSCIFFFSVEPRDVAQEVVAVGIDRKGRRSAGMPLGSQPLPNAKPKSANLGVDIVDFWFLPTIMVWGH
jgi:hypothetical protein